MQVVESSAQPNGDPIQHLALVKLFMYSFRTLCELFFSVKACILFCFPFPCILFNFMLFSFV